MEGGLQHPSVLMKIQGQPCLNYFHKPQVSTPGKCDFLHSVSHVQGSLNRFHPACQGSASASATPMLPTFVGAPLEKGSGFVFLKVTEVIASRIAAAPLHRMKLLMQCQNEIIKTGRLPRPYKGISDCFARTIKNEGIISLWRGNTVNITTYLSYMVLDHTVMPWTMHYLMSASNYKNDKDDKLKVFALYCAVSGVQHFLLHPLQCTYTRLATDTSITDGKIKKWQFSGIVDVWRKTLKSDGIVGFYRGFNIVLLYEMLNNTLSPLIEVGFISQIPVLVKLPGLQGSRDLVSTLSAAIACGIHTCGQLALYPLDTVHYRMMMRSGEAVKYKSSADAFSQILRTEGVGSLYKGASVVILRTAILHCIVLSARILLRRNASAKSGKSDDQGNQGPNSVTIKWKDVH